MEKIECVETKQIQSFAVDFGFQFSIAEAHVVAGKGYLVPLWPPVKDKAFTKMPLCQSYHNHAYFEMIYVLEGKFTEHLENSVYVLNEGEATILNSNIHHYEGCETECRFLFLNFSPEFLKTFLSGNDLYSGKKQHDIKTIMNFCIDETERTTRAALDFRKKLLVESEAYTVIAVLLKKLRKTLHEEHTGYAFYAEYLLVQLFERFEDEQLFSITHIQVKADTSFVLFMEIKHFIEENNGRISLKKLSDVLNYNADYISRIIKKETGQSFSTYCQSVWIGKAKKLLSTTDMSVGKIVLSLGYESSNIFYRVFQEHTGMTPIQYRKKQ
jgi:AraC-like DNA-binding protein